VRFYGYNKYIQIKGVFNMPRPKGSKNKKKTIELSVDNFDEKISSVENEISMLTDQLKTKKAELKNLLKAKEADLAAKAAQKAEEEKAAIIAAVEQSGKSVDEILSMIKGE
jgi:septal ring factor EnvC (AmiA/AmiB activator)